MNDRLYDKLEGELIEANDKRIEMENDCLRLEKELFLIQEELKLSRDEVKYQTGQVSMFKTEIYKLQNISDELAKELRETQIELKYWYNQNCPSIKNVLTNYWEKIKNKLKRLVKR